MKGGQPEVSPYPMPRLRVRIGISMPFLERAPPEPLTVPLLLKLPWIPGFGDVAARTGGERPPHVGRVCG